MNTQAFVLNDDFIAEVWEKIQYLKELLTASEGFESYIHESEISSITLLRKIIETAYWLSHTTEERNPSNHSLVLTKPKKTWDTFCFDYPISLDQSHLAKLGSALDSSFSDICLWPEENGDLKIWGFKMRSLNHLTTRLRVLILRPGSVVIMCYGKSIAAITENRCTFLNPECLFKTLMPKFPSNNNLFDTKENQFFEINALLQISQAMNKHQQGGTLLFVPEDSGWKGSIKQPVHYSGRATFKESGTFTLPPLSRSPEGKITGGLLKMFLDPENKGVVDYRLKVLEQSNRIGRITAADGALVMSQEHCVICFGAKIQAIDTLAGSTLVRVVKPVEGYTESKKKLADLGGTRHQSAAQFVHDQPDAIAIVASQDGSITFFTKDSASGNLLIVQDAELALTHEGILGTFWNLRLLIDE